MSLNKPESVLAKLLRRFKPGLFEVLLAVCVIILFTFVMLVR